MSFFADHNEMIFYGQINVLPYIINIMMFRGQIMLNIKEQNWINCNKFRYSENLLR